MPRPNFVRDTVAGWGRLRPDADLFGLAVVQRLVWNGRLAEDLLERTAIACGLRTRGDYEVLALLRRTEPALLGPVEVTQQLKTSQSGMTGKLDRLERQGLIQRITIAEDRRALKLQITDSGRELIDEAFTTCLRIYQVMLDELSPSEAKTFNSLLEKMLSRLDELSRVSQPWDVG